MRDRKEESEGGSVATTHVARTIAHLHTTKGSRLAAVTAMGATTNSLIGEANSLAGEASNPSGVITSNLIGETSKGTTNSRDQAIHASRIFETMVDAILTTTSETTRWEQRATIFMDD